MITIRRALSGLCLSGLCITAAAAAPEPAGEVAVVRLWAYGTAPDVAKRRDLFEADAVYVLDRLETVADGTLHVRLLDGTMLRLGSASTVVVDEFVFSESGGALDLIATVAKGVCRFVTGRAAVKNLLVKTPAAAITARGTVFSVWIAADGSTTVWVQEGRVDVAPNDGSPTVQVGAREIVLAPIAGGGIILNAPRPKADPGIGDTNSLRMRRSKSRF